MLEVILSAEEKADRINGFVWNKQLPSDDVVRLVRGPLAEAFYTGIEDAVDGIRYRHMASFACHLNTLTEKELTELKVSPDALRVLNNFFEHSGMLPSMVSIPDDIRSITDVTASLV